MPKGINGKKDFKRFKANKQLALMLYQVFAFSLYNARLRLKNISVRHNDALSVLLVGNLTKQACSVSEFKELTGAKISTSANSLNRAVSRGLMIKTKGTVGRGNGATYYLTPKGSQVYIALQTETRERLKEAEKVFAKNVLNNIL